MNRMKGPEEIHIDDEDRPSAVGTGTEDFFQGGWYYKGGPFQTPTHGAAVRSFFSGRASAYRFMKHDPIYFQQSLKVAFTHGIRNEIKTDHSSVAYWCQKEPHTDFT